MLVAEIQKYVLQSIPYRTVLQFQPRSGLAIRPGVLEVRVTDSLLSAVKMIISQLGNSYDVTMGANMHRALNSIEALFHQKVSMG